jgi:hypothetical protein
MVLWFYGSTVENEHDKREGRMRMGRLTQEDVVRQPQPGRRELLAHQTALEAALEGILEALRGCEDEERARVLEA